MSVFYSDDRVTLYAGDCLGVLAMLPENSVDSICTDPPYGLEFMGKDWDRPWAVSPTNGVGYAGRDVLTLPAHRDNRNANCRGCGGRQRGAKRCECPAPQWDRDPAADMRAFQDWCELWATECLRVLKPGGHMLAFGGTRTFHRLACAVEDAGFEIRDSIAWLYGSGFPKSLDVSKAIDKAAPRVGMFTGFAAHYADRRACTGLSHNQICEVGEFYAAVNHGGASTNWERGYNVPTREQWEVLQPLLGLSLDWLPLIERVEAEREVTGQHDNGLATGSAGLTVAGEGKARRDNAATDAAKQWSGWGTALKPAFEPIVVARKPIAGTVAANVQAHGTGALNIDACRVPASEGLVRPAIHRHDNAVLGKGLGAGVQVEPAAGRWPSNVVLDGGMADELDKQSGTSISRIGKPRGAASGDGWGMTATGAEYGDTGGASRFFPTFRYTAKAATTERPTADGIAHPTVKPLDLMRWLIRLVTPPHGVVLDPFAGSGTTGEAAIHEHMHAVLIEREPTYLPLIVARLSKPMAVGFDFEEEPA